jgi:hypothetical protein
MLPGPLRLVESKIYDSGVVNRAVTINFKKEMKNDNPSIEQLPRHADRPR